MRDLLEHEQQGLVSETGAEDFERWCNEWCAFSKVDLGCGVNGTSLCGYVGYNLWAILKIAVLVLEMLTKNKKNVKSEIST